MRKTKIINKIQTWVKVNEDIIPKFGSLVPIYKKMLVKIYRKYTLIKSSNWALSNAMKSMIRDEVMQIIILWVKETIDNRKPKGIIRQG